MNLLERIKKKVFIIAEIGNNHNGDIETAKELIDVAVEAGVDAVKIQTFRGLDIVIPKVLSSAYPDWNVTEYKYWYEFLDSIALSLEDHKDFFDYAKSKGVMAFSTPVSPDRVDFLSDLNVDLFKIASMDVSNIPLLKRFSKVDEPIIVSTGMASYEEIQKAIDIIDSEQLILLHCVSDYPLNYDNANLKSIDWLLKEFRYPVGFSDHSLGYELSVAAVTRGACVIEKHITLNRNSKKKAEHHFSLEPNELKELVGSVRRIEKALGVEQCFCSDNEKLMRLKARRGLHINKDLNEGDVLKEEDISVLRPADGDLPKNFDFYIGKPIKHNKAQWDTLNKEDV